MWHLIHGLIHIRSQLPQILIGIGFWFYFLENDEFWSKMNCVLGCEIALLSASFMFSRKAMQFADETLSFQDSAIRATQWSNILVNINTDYKHSDSPGFVSTLCCNQMWLNSCFDKIKFLCVIVILMWCNRKLFSIIFTKVDFLIVTLLIFWFLIVIHCYIDYDFVHFAFLLQTFFQPEYLGTNTS